jgi:hypothetical protein
MSEEDLKAELERQRPIIEAVDALMHTELELAVATAALDSLESRTVSEGESNKIIARYVEAIGNVDIALDDLRKVAGGWRG